MPSEKKHQAKVSVVAHFPSKYFLENLAVRQDNSILATVANNHELWFVPPLSGDETVTPVLMFTFPEVACGITAVEPDIFYIATGNFYTTHEAYLHRLDLRAWRPGATCGGRREDRANDAVSTFSIESSPVPYCDGDGMYDGYRGAQSGRYLGEAAT
jgi:hypothetical protein